MIAISSKLQNIPILLLAHGVSARPVSAAATTFRRRLPAQTAAASRSANATRSAAAPTSFQGIAVNHFVRGKGKMMVGKVSKSRIRRFPEILNVSFSLPKYDTTSNVNKFALTRTRRDM